MGSTCGGRGRGGGAPHPEAGTVTCKLSAPTTTLTWRKTKTYGHLPVSPVACLMSGPPTPHSLPRELCASVCPRPRQPDMGGQLSTAGHGCQKTKQEGQLPF